MKKILVISIILFLFPIPLTFAGEKLILKPRHRSFGSNDNFRSPGSRRNPYIIKNESGRKIGEVKSKYHDFTPDDGFRDQGTRQNPWIVEFD